MSDVPELSHLNGESGVTGAVQSPPSRQESRSGEAPWHRGWRRFRRHLLAMTGLVTLSLLVVISVSAPLIAPYSPFEINLRDRAQPPSTTHWLGTDTTGRDAWARVSLAGRVSLSVGLVAASIATLVGTLIGSIAGYFGGRIDTVLMRITDVVMTFPALVVIIALVSVFGPSIYNTMIGIGMLTWPTTARLVRGEFLTLRESAFVEAARGLGAGDVRVIFKHTLPNAIGPVVVAATFGVASAILLEAGLSFLGLGVQPPTPSWGNMLRDAQSLTILETMPWLWVPPGMMIIMAVLSINFIGDGLRDAIDPRSNL